MTFAKLNRQKGYGMAEYLLGAAMLSAILFVPFKRGEQSLAVQLTQAVKKEYSAYIYASQLTQIPSCVLSNKKCS